MLTLMNLPTSGSAIKIIQQSSAQYRKIGIILLNDRYGARIGAIQKSNRGQYEDIILEIYKEWLAEDPNCSWVTLTDCFRQCGLHSLARSIEQHFGLPSPLLDTEGMV